MLWCETMLVSSRQDIFVDGWYNQSFHDFSYWQINEIDRYEDPCVVSLPGFGIVMTNDDFHIAGI